MAAWRKPLSRRVRIRSVRFYFLGQERERWFAIQPYKKAGMDPTFLYGGEGGIRTLETIARLHDFESCAFSRSATSPSNINNISTSRSMLGSFFGNPSELRFDGIGKTLATLHKRMPFTCIFLCKIISDFDVARSAGFEPAASGSASQRSIQLSYERTCVYSAYLCGNETVERTVCQSRLLPCGG